MPVTSSLMMLLAPHEVQGALTAQVGRAESARDAVAARENIG
jgi:hypothetical protein